MSKKLIYVDIKFETSAVYHCNCKTEKQNKSERNLKYLERTAKDCYSFRTEDKSLTLFIVILLI